MKYIVSAYVTFFESFHTSLHKVQEFIPLSPFVPLYAPAPTHVHDVSSLGSPTDTTELHAPKPLQDSRYAYTHRPKILASESVPANSSPVESHSQPSAPPSDLDVLIALCKGKRVCNDHPVFYFIFRDHLNLSFRQFALSLSSVSIPKSYRRQYRYQPESSLWIRRWMH